MDTVSRPIDVRVNKRLTRKQQSLLQAIERRRRNGLPTVQQDLAEAMGIRRESLNKLLRRTRERLAARGERLELPPRAGPAPAGLVALADGVWV